MADAYDRNRRRRRRDRNEYGRQSEDVSPSPSKPPVTILGLAKPSKTTLSSECEDNTSSTGGESQHTEGPSVLYSEISTDNQTLGDKSSVVLLSSENKPRVTMVKSHHEGDSTDSRSYSSPNDDSSHSSEESHSHPSIPMKRSSASVPSAVGNMISGVIDQGAQTQSKLAPPLEKQGKIKLIDDSFQWCDTGLELMLDQTDFVVIGIVGLQGCGKSTLLSLLAGNTHQDAYRNYFFFPQTKETKEDCLFQTSGIDMFVTSERVILLDSQPLLSAAVMDCQLRYERKFPSEYSSLQNFIEMQSMQLLTFLLSVCNIVLVADDWFTDLNFLRFIQDAEMLKPSTQLPSSSSTDGSSTKEDGSDFYPTVIFVHNKASRDDFSADSYFSMQQVLHRVFQSSKLKVRNNINMTNGCQGDAIIHRVENMTNQEAGQFNLLMLPVMEFYKSEPEWLQTMLPDYRGYPSFNTLLAFYRAQVLSAHRSPVTPSTLTEKNWYHFAARMWESVKKSPLLAEYNRLLS
ncbi:protein SMG9-like [Aplysia californica]|uniref:Protein SMG9-like n=1 Tax=Aplysia californica TaxID=6500 RepID=A0ABM0JTP3_APLCA|nr:protein SMG9-like [Aplysia californica]